MITWWKYFLTETFWILCAPRHTGKSGQQKNAEAQTKVEQGNEAKDTAAAQSTYGQFEGPVEKSPFYKAMLTNGIESTSSAYNNARSNMAAKANQAGFGYSQPIAQGGGNQMAAAEAESLARVPRDAMISAAPLSMQAAGGSASMANAEGGRGEQYNNDAYGMQKGRAGLWNQLFQAGVSAATGMGTAAIQHCWVAAAAYDGWDDPRVHAVRAKLWADAAKSRSMRLILGLYLAFGEYVGFVIGKSDCLRRVTRKFLDRYLGK